METDTILKERAVYLSDCPTNYHASFQSALKVKVARESYSRSYGSKKGHVLLHTVNMVTVDTSFDPPTSLDITCMYVGVHTD